MREKVELLENHADLGSHGIDVLGCVERNPIDDNAAFVELFQAVDAAQHGRFSRAGWSDNDHHFALLHFQVDAFEGFQCPEIFMHTLDFDNRFHGLPLVAGLFFKVCDQTRSQERHDQVEQRHHCPGFDGVKVG